MTQTVLVAGATGRLGGRVAHHLLGQPGTRVRLLVRDPAAKAAQLAPLVGRGAEVVEGSLSDPDALERATRGEQVRFVTGARFAEAVGGTGATHVALPPESDFDDRMDVNATFPERRELRGTALIAFDVETLFVRPGRGQYDALARTIAAAPAPASGPGRPR